MANLPRTLRPVYPDNSGFSDWSDPITRVCAQCVSRTRIGSRISILQFSPEAAGTVFEAAFRGVPSNVQFSCD
jgi:hypothetical protein